MKTTLSIFTSLLVLITTSCSKDTAVNEVEEKTNSMSKDDINNPTSKGHNSPNTLSADWGLHNIWNGEGCSFCQAPCDCFDEIEITASIASIKSDLDNAISSGTVDLFFAESNRSNWTQLFPNDVCVQLLIDLQNGHTTVEIGYEDPTTVSYHLVLTSTGGSATYYKSEHEC